MKQASVGAKTTSATQGKPPITTGAAGVDPGLSGLTNKQQPSKWAINIQEIVKRTQKNLERGPSSQKASQGDAHKVGSGSEIQYLAKHLKSGFGSSSTKDKSSLLYHDLKKKLTYDSGPHQDLGSAGFRGKHETLLNFHGGLSNTGGTLNSAKSMRPTSLNAQHSAATTQIAQKSLHLASQKSALQDRLAIARLKRKNTASEQPDGQLLDRAGHHSANDLSQLSGSFQGGQGGGVQGVNGETFQPYGSGTVALSSQRAQTRHGGRQNLLSAQREDDQATIITTGMMNQWQPSSADAGAHQPIAFRRHNSNLHRGTQNYENLIGEGQTAIANETANDCVVEEVGASEEHTRRGDGNSRAGRQSSMDRIQMQGTRNMEEVSQPMLLTANGGDFLPDADLQAKPTGKVAMSATGQTGTKLPSSFTEQPGKRQTDVKGKSIQSSVEHRQKIFEEEIIKRVKEIQRYVKSLHLQVKKTQGGVDKLRDEVDSDKDVLLSVQQQVEAQGKKQQADRLKTVTSADLEAQFKDFDARFNEKLLLVVQEAADQTLKQVSDNVIPDTRLKMYDSITEEANRVKSEFQFEMQALKREFQDASKQAQLKSKERLDGDSKLLLQELATEQTARNLHLMAQVDAQIAKALSEARSLDSMPRTEIQNLRTETIERIRSIESKVSTQIGEEVAKELDKSKERSDGDFNRRLKDLEGRLQSRLEASVAQARDSQHVLDELDTQLAQCRSDLMKAVKSEAKKAAELSQSAFVSPDKLQGDLVRLKKDLAKQITTSLEEAKFDAVQMVQTDLHAVAAAQKEASLKLQELSNATDEAKSDLSAVESKVQSQGKESGLKVNAVEGKLMELRSKIDSLERELKHKELQAAQAQAQLPSASPEEVDELRAEISDIRNSCNLIQASADEAKMAASNSKSGQEKLFKGVRQQLDELARKVAEDAADFNESRQVLEDALNDVSQAQTVLDEKLNSQQRSLGTVQQGVAGAKTEAAKQAKDLGQLSTQMSAIEADITRRVNEVEANMPDLSPMEADIANLAQRLTQCEKSSQSEVAKVLKMHKETKMDFEDNITQLDNQVSSIEHWMAKAKEDLIQLKSLPRPSSQSPQTSKVAQVTNQQVTELTLRFDQLRDDFSGELARLDKEIKVVDKDMDAMKIRADELAQCDAKLRTDLSAVATLADTLESRVERQEETGSRTETKLSQLSEAVQKPPEVTQADLSALEHKLASSKLEIEEKLRLIGSEQEQLRLTQQASSPAKGKHEPGQVRKVEAKKPTSQWTTVKVGKIEPKETVSALRSSEIMVSAAAPSTTQAKQSELKVESPFEQPMTLSTPHQEKQLQGDSGSPYGLAFDPQTDRNVSQGNAEGLKDPTNQSASVEQHSQILKEQLEAEEPQILEIENPVQFEVVGQSESKVTDSNSMKESLQLKQNMGFPDDRTLNEGHLISPSDGVQVIDGDFYKLQREISSTYVPKKNQIALGSQQELALGSAPPESPSPLDKEPFDEEKSVQEESAQDSPQAALDSLEPAELAKNVTAADLEQMEWQNESKQITQGSQAFRTQKMAGLNMISQKATQQVADGLGEADLELELEQELQASPSLQESGSQLPDGESLDGCNNFLKKFEANATKHKSGTGLGLMKLNFNDGQDELPSSRDGHNLEDEFNQILDSGNFNLPSERNDGGAIQSARQDSVNRLAMEIDQLQCDDVALQSNQKSEFKLLGSLAGEDDDENGFDDAIPSNAVLNMKLGAHMKKPSDGKSSMMGLSALGLESQRESHASEDRESDVLRIVEMLVGEEISEAIDIMQVLGHPHACGTLMQEL